MAAIRNTPTGLPRFDHEQKYHSTGRKDLNPQGGVFCPSPHAGMETWDTHPKVYLDVGKTGEAKCPYCGTLYKLKDGEHFHGH
jgi:uncharacterized Zn-finger protein